MSDTHLAIVIPAFKKKYIEKSLDSIASQTNRNFTLYIGDDNSPEDIYAIVKKYTDRLKIIYKKFDFNFGHISLAKQWERCIEMTKGEDWIWLFSDDDIMSEDCVEIFFSHLDNSSVKFDLYRFNCSIINDAGFEISKSSNYPKIQSSHEFLISRLKYQYHSYISNYIFSRSIYIRHNGFVEFETCWATDDATWILFGQNKKMFTFNSGEVKWRQSAINISGNVEIDSNRIKKYIGTQQFIQWIYFWTNENNLELDNRVVIEWFRIMLNSIGFKKVIFPYFKSTIFRKYFWKVNIFYQLDILFNKNP